MLKGKDLRALKFTLLMPAITILCFLVCGCSAISIPNPEEVVKHPLGTESIKVGMTKDQVESIWGRPSQIKTVEDKEKWQGSREVWIYHAQYSAIPVNAGYFSKNRRLYFDGNNLTQIGD